MPENLLEGEMTDVSELSEARWSVISFERCEADGLTYEQAIEKRGELERQKIAGLCIMTNDAAARIKTNDM